jgi:hypothetical protein
MKWAGHIAQKSGSGGNNENGDTGQLYAYSHRCLDNSSWLCIAFLCLHCRAVRRPALLAPPLPGLKCSTSAALQQQWQH